MKKYRDWQKRIIFKDAIYFVTADTYDFYPYFKERIFCDLFVENLRLCKFLKGFLLYGWVLNYDHFHLLIQPNDEWDISKSMFSIKKQFSHNCNVIMGYNEFRCRGIRKSDVSLSAPSDTPSSTPSESGQSIVHFRGVGLDYVQHMTLYQKINRMDVLVCILKTRFQLKYPNGHTFLKFIWHESFHDHFIRNDWDLDDKLEYIAYNPEKHELPEYWQYVFINPKYDNLTDETV